MLLLHYFVYSISITTSSWLIGMILNEFIKKREWYKSISNLNFIKNKTLQKGMGLHLFKWIVKNTFFKFLNQKLKLKNKIELAELIALRKEMTYAEISHLIAFICVTIFAVIKFIPNNYFLILSIQLANILLNLYPALLQQENKRRIDQFFIKSKTIIKT